MSVVAISDRTALKKKNQNNYLTLLLFLLKSSPCVTFISFFPFYTGKYKDDSLCMVFKYGLSIPFFRKISFPHIHCFQYLTPLMSYKITLF